MSITAQDRARLLRLSSQFRSAGSLHYEGDTALDMTYAMSDFLEEIKRAAPHAKSAIRNVQQALYALEVAVAASSKTASVQQFLTMYPSGEAEVVADAGLTIIRYTIDGRNGMTWNAAAFAGRSSKPLWHYGYRRPELREKAVADLVSASMKSSRCLASRW